MKKKWNISILVIFVLLASSLLGVLSMTFVQQMMKQSAVVNSYYKAHYLAKAWIELWLVQVKHRGVGFNYTINTWDKIILDNFSCGANCSISTTLSGTASLLSKKFWQGSGCSSPFVLTSGDSLIVPLVRDAYSWNVAGTFASWIAYQNLADLFKNDKIQIKNISSPPDQVTFGLLILSGQDLYENGVFFRSWFLNTLSLHDFKTAFESYMIEIHPAFTNYYWSSTLIAHGFRIYLMISNTAATEQSFCLQTISNTFEQAYVLPTDSFFIQSQASYGNQKVWLDASYTQPIPWFLFAL